MSSKQDKSYTGDKPVEEAKAQFLASVNKVRVLLEQGECSLHRRATRLSEKAERLSQL